MSRVFAPRSVRELRFLRDSDHKTPNWRVCAHHSKRMGSKDDLKNEEHLERSFAYLNRVVKRVLVSEKYVLEPSMLVLQVRPEADKLLIKTALDSISDGNWVKKVTSVNYKPVTKTFRSRLGMTSAYKKMYVRFNTTFDSSILTGGES